MSTLGEWYVWCSYVSIDNFLICTSGCNNSTPRATLSHNDQFISSNISTWSGRNLHVPDFYFLPAKAPDAKFIITKMNNVAGVITSRISPIDNVIIFVQKSIHTWRIQLPSFRDGIILSAGPDWIVEEIYYLNSLHSFLSWNSSSNGAGIEELRNFENVPLTCTVHLK